VGYKLPPFGLDRRLRDDYPFGTTVLALEFTPFVPGAAC